MKLKKTLAALLAITTAAALTACGGTAETTETEATTTTESQTEWTGDNIALETVAEDKEPTVDISGQTITFLGIADINPTNSSPERSVPLTLFEDTYGAKVEYVPTTYNQKFDDLATLIIGGTPPDIFLYEWMAFPYGVSQGQYQPIDSLVDFSDPLWADMQSVADDFTMDSQHYVAPLGYRFKDTQVLMYNKTLYEEEGIDDPMDMFNAGTWDWDAFTSVMKQFVDSDPDNRMGIAGWWANAFVFTAGDTVVTYDGNNFHNNINSANIEKAELVLEDLTKNNLIQIGWTGGAQAFANDQFAFYGMGTWAYNDAQKAREDVEIQIVPFPKCPGSDTNYVSNALHAYMWVKGSEKSDAVKTWFECCRKEYTEEAYVEAAKAKFLENNKYWTEDLYDLVMNFYDPEQFTQVFDYGYGISRTMSDTDSSEGCIIKSVYEGIANAEVENWAQCKDTNSDLIDAELEAYAK